MAYTAWYDKKIEKWRLTEVRWVGGGWSSACYPVAGEFTTYREANDWIRAHLDGAHQERARVLQLRHPELDAPAEAIQMDYWLEKGRAKGLRLRFADGDRCLTFAEIRRLQQAWRQQEALASVPA